MKLLFVIHQYFPQCYSGTEQYCLAVSREARRRGDEVVVLSLVPDFGRPKPPILLVDEPYDGFKVLRLRHWALLQPNDQLRDYDNPLLGQVFRDVLGDEQPDAVHFFHLRFLGSNFIPVAQSMGVRTVVNLMDFWFLCPRFILLRSDGQVCDGPPDGGLGCLSCHYPDLAGSFGADDVREASLAMAGAMRSEPQDTSRGARVAAVLRRKDIQLERLAMADAIIAPSRFLASMFEHNGFPKDRMTVVPYGLEPNRVERIETTRPRDPVRFAFAGIMSPWKSPRVVVDAARRLDGRFSLKVHGPIDEPAFRDYTDAMRRAAEGDDRIEFPGPYDREALGRVLADTDVLIVPSTWYENTPFVILEAFEAGVPVIASDLGGMSELIEEGVNGFTFEAGNPEALAAVMKTLIDDPQRIAALSPKRPSQITDNYDTFAELYRAT